MYSSLCHRGGFFPDHGETALLCGAGVFYDDWLKKFGPKNIFH